MPCDPESIPVSTHVLGASSCRRSHAASRVVDGESTAPVTRTAVTGSYGGWSSTAAS
jgi:hypothetical protein